MAIGGLIGVLVGVVGMGALQVSLRPVMNEVAQFVFPLMPNELLPPATLASLLRREKVGLGVFENQMMKQGFDSSTAQMIYADNERFMNAFEAIALWRRDGITETERDKRVVKAGWPEDHIDDLLRMTEVIPAASDIIRFAVREVYSPEIAERFGQFDGVGEVFRNAEKDIKAVGMTEDTFRNFWAAHWELPSLRQGFEMLHRQVIKPDDLDKLMEAVDVMPFWRDKLTAIAHNPYTRVDVRRMHKLGILSETEVTTAYKDLGYDDDKAKNMTRFTLEYNEAVPESESTSMDVEVRKQKEATKASILKAFRNNIISGAEAEEFLNDLGYTVEAIELYIAIELFAFEEEITDSKVSTIREAYVKRIYDLQKTVILLNELNLPARQTEMLLDRWIIEREARASHPSKAELFKFHKNKVISDLELRGELAGHGYNEKYINWYMQGQAGKSQGVKQ